MTSEIQSNKGQPMHAPEDAGSPVRYLVKGDISGIQGFIFNVNSKLAAQSLKGRSFFIKVLLELGMKMIFDERKIIDENARQAAKVSTSGGNFILLLELPDLNLIDQLQDRLNIALQFTGLNLLLAAAPFDEKNYSASLKDLNQKIRVRKYQLLRGKQDFFEPFERSNTSGINDNNKWVKVTERLKKASCFSIQQTPAVTTNGALSIEGNRMELAGYTVKFGNEGIPLKNYLESLFPGHVTFEMMAQDKSEKGIQKLGVLAMDVDNLGAELETVDSPELHRDFDQRLQKFFNDELRRIINEDFKDKIYVVTAGGDDSYFVGKWNVLLDLAIKIKKAFLAAFQKTTLTISGALVIVDANFPVVRFAEMADDAIKDAKYKYPGYKGNFNLFGEVLDWGIFEKEITALRNKFNKNRKDLITSGLLTKARQTSLKIAQSEGMQLSDFWKIGYFMRNFEGEGSAILKSYHKYLSDAIVQKNPVKQRTYKLIFPVAARLSEFDNRKN